MPHISMALIDNSIVRADYRWIYRPRTLDQIR
jgi:hypothetical protein